MNRTCSSGRWRMWLAIALTLVAASAVMAAQAPVERQQMMQSMTTADQKLSELVATMNAAKGDKKVEAMAAVITELVAQRKQMQDQMRMQGSMMEQMMSRMAAMHGSGGTMKGTAEPKKDAPEADHATHHPDK